MKPSVDAGELWARLAAAGLTTGDMPAAGPAASPWYVRVMLGIAGWIGALFLLGFFGAALAAVFESATVALVLGTLLCAIAATVFRSAARNDFVGQFALATSIAGQTLIAFGLSTLLPDSPRVVAGLLAAVQCVLFLVVPDFLHRIWTGVTGICAVVFVLMTSILVPFIDGALLGALSLAWLAEFDHGKQHEQVRAVGYSLAIVLVLDLFVNVAQVDWSATTDSGVTLVYTASVLMRLLSATLTGIVLIVTAYVLLQRVGANATPAFRAVALGAALVLALVSVRAPGIAITVTMLVLGYAHGNRTLAGFAIASLLGYLSVFYYMLDYTLLAKSAVLVATGTALLCVYALLRRFVPAAAGTGDA